MEGFEFIIDREAAMVSQTIRSMLTSPDAAALDVVADDGQGMKQEKTNYHWDKKSKKYIKLNNGDRVTVSGKIKTESGAKVKANKAGAIYKKWKDSTHKKAFS